MGGKKGRQNGMLQGPNFNGDPEHLLLRAQDTKGDPEGTRGKVLGKEYSNTGVHGKGMEKVLSRPAFWSTAAPGTKSS